VTLTRTEIQRHIQDDRQIAWIPAKELLADAIESCVDGRGELGVIGTPGGNAGEFLLSLAAVEEASGQPIDAQQIPTYLDSYLSEFGRFYMHGDTHALSHLPAELLDQAAPAENEARRIGNFLRKPPAELHARLLDELVKPPNIGCGHLKLMLNRPDDYGVRPELTTAFLKAFFRALWSGAPVDYIVLDGDHREGAVVNIVIEGEVSSDMLVPTITPQVNGQQMFINHPQAVSFLRSELARGIGRILPIEVEAETLKNGIDALAERQLGHTLMALAKGLPLFEVRFPGPNQAPEVIAAGEVA